MIVDGAQVTSQNGTIEEETERVERGGERGERGGREEKMGEKCERYIKYSLQPHRSPPSLTLALSLSHSLTHSYTPILPTANNKVEGPR